MMVLNSVIEIYLLEILRAEDLNVTLWSDVESFLDDTVLYSRAVLNYSTVLKIRPKTILLRTLLRPF